MRVLKLIILLIVVFSIKLNAQNVVHLCVGDNHNFGVPNILGSIYNWEMENINPYESTINISGSVYNWDLEHFYP